MPSPDFLFCVMKAHKGRYVAAGSISAYERDGLFNMKIANHPGRNLSGEEWAAILNEFQEHQRMLTDDERDSTMLAVALGEYWSEIPF